MKNVGKIFMSGDSQAARLPKGFRFNTSEVWIFKEGDKVILSPKPKITWNEYCSKYKAEPDLEFERPDDRESQQRETLG